MNVNVMLIKDWELHSMVILWSFLFSTGEISVYELKWKTSAISLLVCLTIIRNEQSQSSLNGNPVTFVCSVRLQTTLPASALE